MTGNLDDLLRSAGERWRSTQPPPPQPDPDRWLDPVARSVLDRWPDPARPAPRRRWAAVLVTSAATVVVVATASMLAVQTRDGGRDDTTGARTGYVSTATAQSPADLVVRDGMRVRASGIVLAVPGQPVRFCAPAITTAPAGANADVPACIHGVVVTGVDLDALAEPAERAGSRFGGASLTGTWRSGVLVVTDQAPPAPPAAHGSPAIPCPAPPGGWKATGYYVDGKALHAYIDGHTDQFRRPWVSRTDDGTEVLVVEVVRGDADAARTELRRRYPGNLCVVSSPGRSSLAEQATNLARVQPAVTELMRDPTTGVYALGGPDNIVVEMVMLTADLYDRLAAIGLAAVDLNPWLRPVR